MLKILAIGLIAVIAVGELAAYYYDPYSFDAECEWTSGEASYKVHSSGYDIYDVVVLDGSTPLDDAFVYVDEVRPDFDTMPENDSDPKYVDSAYHAEQVCLYASVHGFDNTTVGGSAELERYILDTSASPSGHAIIVLSFSLPASVYMGNPDDPLLKWISDGGALYWTASEIGAYYHEGETLFEVADGQTLFLGSECQNLSVDRGDSVKAGNGFRDALSLKTSQPLFGVDLSMAGGCLPLAYVTEGISSITMVGLGSGSVCILGGVPDIDMYDDFGQLLSSGIDRDTVLVSHTRGYADHGTSEGTVSISGSDQTLFIYIGGIYTMYGRLFVQ